MRPGYDLLHFYLKYAGVFEEVNPSDTANQYQLAFVLQFPIGNTNSICSANSIYTTIFISTNTF